MPSAGFTFHLPAVTLPLRGPFLPRRPADAPGPEGGGLPAPPSRPRPLQGSPFPPAVAFPHSPPRPLRASPPPPARPNGPHAAASRPSPATLGRPRTPKRLGTARPGLGSLTSSASPGRTTSGPHELRPVSGADSLPRAHRLPLAPPPDGSDQSEAPTPAPTNRKPRRRPARARGRGRFRGASRAWWAWLAQGGSSDWSVRAA